MDLINRQDAIDLLEYWSGGFSYIEVETELAIRDFQHLTTVQQWIPCKCITALIDHEVLCCDQNGSELIGWLNYNDYYSCWVCESDEGLMYDVIAYMEKPEPWRNEES